MTTRMERSDGYEPKFDINIQEGEEGEILFVDALGLPAGKYEVKRKSYEDAKFYVEYAHDPGRTGTYKPSGVVTTHAVCLGYVINDTGIIVIFPTWRLRECLILERGQWRKENDGDCPTLGLLVSWLGILSV